MGWGTEFKCNVYFHKQYFRDEFELKDKIQELEDQVNLYKEQLLMFCASSPKDLITEDWKDEPIRFIHLNVKELLEELSETERALMKLYIVQEHFDTKIET